MLKYIIILICCLFFNHKLATFEDNVQDQLNHLKIKNSILCRDMELKINNLELKVDSIMKHKPYTYISHP